MEIERTFAQMAYASYCSRDQLTLSDYVDAFGTRSSAGLDKLVVIKDAVQLLSFAVKCNLNGFFQSLLEFEEGCLLFDQNSLVQLFKFSIDTKRFSIVDRIGRFSQSHRIDIFGELLTPLHFAFDYRCLPCDAAKETPCWSTTCWTRATVSTRSTLTATRCCTSSTRSTRTTCTTTADCSSRSGSSGSRRLTSADPNSYNAEGFTPFLVAVSRNQKRAVNHTFSLNKQLQASLAGKPLVRESKIPRHIDTSLANRLTGKTCFHYACETPSLLMLIDLARDSSASILAVDHHLRLPSKSIPFVNLTSRKYALKLEQFEARERLCSDLKSSEADFDFDFSFHADTDADAARPETRCRLAPLSLKYRDMLRVRVSLKPKPADCSDSQQKKPIIASKVALRLKQPLDSHSKESKSFLQLRPAAGSKPFARIALNTPSRPSATHSDARDSSHSGPSHSFNSGTPTRHSKVSLEFKLKMHGDQVFESHLARLKQVLFGHPAHRSSLQ